MAEKKETKQCPLKKGDFVRIAMEVMMKQHEPKTKEELQELKALEKEVEGLETQLTALVGGYIIQSDLLQKHTSMALLMAACISTCDILFMVEQLGDMKGITPSMPSMNCCLCINPCRMPCSCSVWRKQPRMPSIPVRKRSQQ